LSAESPDVVLYDVNGNPLAVQNATAIPANTSGILSLGSDGTNSRYITIDTSGRQLVVGAAASGAAVAGNPLYLGSKSPAGNAIGAISDSVGSLIASIGGDQFTVQANSTVTTSGSTTVTNNDFGAQQISLIINITASPTGTTPTLTYTIQELDPGNGTTVMGNSVSSSALSTTGVTIITLTSTTSNNIKVSWTIAGTTPSFTGVYSTLVSKVTPTTQSITTNDATASGTLGAANATVQLAVTGERTAGMLLAAGTLIGTIVPEISMDGGTTWVQTFFDDPSTSNIMTSVVFASSNTATTKTIVGAGGSSDVRVRVSAYTSGSATCNVRAVQLDDPSVMFGGAAGAALPPVVMQDGGSVTTSAPAYSTGTLNALSLNTTGDLRVISKISDGTNGPAAVKAASTAPVAADPALVVTLSPNNGIYVVDKASMTPGVQAGQPTIGQSSNVGRIPRVNRLGHTVPGDQTLMAYDPIEGTTVNSWLWTTSTATMTVAQTTGLLTLNNNSTTTTTTDAIITSNVQFTILNETPIECSFRALATQTTNSTIELGFGAPTGTTATINNGAFFRIQNSGQIKCVTSFNGTETVSSVIATLTTTSYYLFVVTMEDDGSRFIVEDANGIPIVDTFRALPVATAGNSAASHIPVFARVYNSGAAGAAAQLKISSFQAWRFDISSSKPWAHQLAGAGKSSGIDPLTFTQTGQIFTTAPSAAVLTSSGVNYTTLGGDFDIGQASGSETQYGIFGYQVPSPYSLYITELYMPQPFVTTQLGGTLNIQEWSFMIANSNNPTTATGYRYSLGIFTAPLDAAVGTIYTGTPIQQTFTCPLVVQPGQYFLVICKHLYGTTTGVTRGTILINGYFE
jgi:hypothetical protein